MSSLYNYKAKVVNVVDGDTIDVVIDLGFYVSVKQRIRFHGIDTPEIRTRDEIEKTKGLAAKDFVVKAIDGKEIRLSVLEKDKYGRYLGVISYGPGFKNLNQELLDKGLAEEYKG